MNKTSYEKEGLNSLNELFEKLIVCSEKQDKEGTLRIVSSLNDEEKDYLYTWATEQGKLDKVAGIVVKAEMDKKAFDINCRFKKTLCEALVQNGYCLEGDPDVYNSDSFPFTDNKYINGEVIFDTRKVQLKARDAENRKYEKTIDYSSVGDLMESINHFRKDIEETFNKPEVVEEVVKEEPFDILGDKNFLKEIGADWVTDLIKKKAEDSEEGSDSYMTVWLYPGSGANLYGFATEATSEEEALEKVSFYLVQNNLNTFYMTSQEYQDFMKDFYPELSEEELQEKMDNDETVMYVDGGGNAQVYLTGFDNAKIEKGINEKYLDQISIIDGPRNSEGPLEKAKKRLEEQPQGNKSASIKGGLGKKADNNFNAVAYKVSNEFDPEILKKELLEDHKALFLIKDKNSTFQKHMVAERREDGNIEIDWVPSSDDDELASHEMIFSMVFPQAYNLVMSEALKMNLAFPF